MYDISENGIETRQADTEIVRLMRSMELDTQTEWEKYEVIKPFFERLNLPCNELNLKFERDSSLFPIPLSSIVCAKYEEESDTLLLLFKKNRSLHVLDQNKNSHIVYLSGRGWHSFVTHLLRLYNRVKLFLHFQPKI